MSVISNPGHFTGQFSFLSVCAPDYIPLSVPLPRQSCGQQWAVERQPQSQRSEWGSNQTHYHHCWCCRPERGQRAHQLPHRSSQPRPEPRPLGDSQPLCVISNLTIPQAYWREKDRGRGGGREGGQRERKKSTQRPRDLFVTWTMIRASERLAVAGSMFFLLLASLTGQVAAVAGELVNEHHEGSVRQRAGGKWVTIRGETHQFWYGFQLPLLLNAHQTIKKHKMWQICSTDNSPCYWVVLFVVLLFALSAMFLSLSLLNRLCTSFCLLPTNAVISLSVVWCSSCANKSKGYAAHDPWRFFSPWICFV